jgi:hypothetical protein
VHTLVARTGQNASATIPREAAARADTIILAVPGEALDDISASLGTLDGKIVVHVSGGLKRVAPDGYLGLVSESTTASGSSPHTRKRASSASGFRALHTSWSRCWSARRPMSSSPATNVAELFGFGRPAELDNVPAFPRRDSLVPCDEWRQRIGRLLPQD